MPRRPRVFVDGLTYHVYNRVARGEAPFKLDDEAERFWHLLHEVKIRDGLAVYAWCVMPNHYHLAVRTASVPLWRSIRFLQHRYAREFNRRCRVLGPVWQSRYKARPVQEQGSLFRLLAYIHLNPVTARMVDEAARYRWSGHREIVRPARRPLVDVDQVLAMFGGTRRQAVRAYEAMLRQERDEPWLLDRLERLPWWSGEPSGERPGQGAETAARPGRTAGRVLAAEEFLRHVCPLLGLEARALASPRRDPPLVDARDLVGALAVERWGVGVKVLALALDKSEDGVSLWLRRAARRRNEDQGFAERLEDLDRRLAASLAGESDR